MLLQASIFLLTRPSRSVTRPGYTFLQAGGISTHTPLAERDGDTAEAEDALRHFYTHAPRGAAIPVCIVLRRVLLISTHTPLAERDFVRCPVDLIL